MSMVFNALLDHLEHVYLRVLLFVLWPLCGIMLLRFTQAAIPDWVLPLAVFTSALYALRMLTLREVNQWTGFLATSLWSLLWLEALRDIATLQILLYGLGVTVPLVLLLFLSDGLEKRFGAAYTGLDWGLVRTIPHFASVLVTVIFACIATPLFPSFFIMFDLIVESVATAPWVATGLLLIWLFWSWAGTRLIQDLIVGRSSDQKIEDMNTATIILYSTVLILLMFCGIYLGGVIL
jgi:NADH:ubiquinone oxidoreductase subunit 4 (subunit M)